MQGVLYGPIPLVNRCSHSAAAQLLSLYTFNLTGCDSAHAEQVTLWNKYWSLPHALYIQAINCFSVTWLHLTLSHTQTFLLLYDTHTLASVSPYLRVRQVLGNSLFTQCYSFPVHYLFISKGTGIIKLLKSCCYSTIE